MIRETDRQPHRNAGNDPLRRNENLLNGWALASEADEMDSVAGDSLDAVAAGEGRGGGTAED
jgi:hypothetical protein